MVAGVESICNVSITAYQHLQCPKGLFGPGCEQKCECDERESCHYIRGCHIGNMTFFNFIYLQKLHFCTSVHVIDANLPS